MDEMGIKLAAKNEREFKSALADINKSFKVLGSEMKLVQSQFDKNDDSVEALTARNTVLNKQIVEQKDKIALLKNALHNAAESFGENDKRTQSWQIQLNNAQAALNKMERELRENTAQMERADSEYDDAETTLAAVEDEMDDVADSAREMGKEIDGAGKDAERSEGRFQKLGDVLKTIGITIGAVVTAAGAVSVKLGKEVVSAYSDYEQLAGGVETLFNESAGRVRQYSENAYKTAGMSANQYMENVTAFSASLIQSLGGDTEKAAEMADKAIVDMSDNANKMGSDITSIQNAYQGFAKQNYTMLDNLKLGYGGTKTEMERLLKNAQAISGIEYNIESYADIIDAIHVIQTEMGITGTTAREAEATISGSISMTKSSLHNLVTGFGDADADIKKLCEDVVSSFSLVISNVKPILENIVAALPAAIDAMIDAAVELLPTLLDAFTGLLSQILTSVLTALPRIFPTIINALGDVVDTIVENIPLIVSSVMQMMSMILNAVAGALPQLIPTIVSALMEAVQAVIDNLGAFVDAGVQIILGLVKGIVSAIPSLIEKIPALVESVVQAVRQALPALIEGAKQLIAALAKALPEIIRGIVAILPELLKMLVDSVKTLLPVLVDGLIEIVRAIAKALPDILSAIVDALPALLDGILNAVIELLPVILDAVVQLIIGIVNALPELIKSIVDVLPDLIGKIITAVIGLIPTLIQALVACLPTLIDGLIQLITGIVAMLPDIIKGLIEALPQIITAVITGLMQALPQLILGLIQLVMELVLHLPEIILALVEAIPTIIETLVDTLLDGDNLEKLIQGCVEMNIKLAEEMPRIIAKLVEEVPKIVDRIVSKFKSLIGRFTQMGGDMLSGLWQGISDKAQWLRDQIGGFFGGIVDNIKNFFGIHSPSTLFRDEIGKNMALGIGEGFVNEMNRVSRDMQNAVPARFDTNVQASAYSGNEGAPRSIVTNISFGDVTLASDMDIDDVAQRVSDVIVLDILQKERAYA